MKKNSKKSCFYFFSVCFFVGIFSFALLSNNPLPYSAEPTFEIEELSSSSFGYLPRFFLAEDKALFSLSALFALLNIKLFSGRNRSVNIPSNFFYKIIVCCNVSALSPPR